VEELPVVVERPTDIEPRTRMLAGAVLGGRCLQNASMGVHHALAQLLGGRTGMPHGLANAVLLPHALRFNRQAAPQEIEQIARALGGASDAAGAVDALLLRLGLPVRLSDCGVDDEDLEVVARLAESPDARAILEAAF
jgi:maleylacetate reductase